MSDRVTTKPVGKYSWSVLLDGHPTDFELRECEPSGYLVYDRAWYKSWPVAPGLLLSLMFHNDSYARCLEFVADRLKTTSAWRAAEHPAVT